MSLSRIRTLLLSDTDIATAVGTKVYVGFAPKEVKTPFILLEELAQAPNSCKDGYSVMDSYAFGVTVVDVQYKVVEQILGYCRSTLSGYIGDEFKKIFYAGIEERYDGTQDYFIKTNSYQSLIEVL